MQLQVRKKKQREKKERRIASLPRKSKLLGEVVVGTSFKPGEKMKY